jgi:hypothetical protein
MVSIVALGCGGGGTKETEQPTPAPTPVENVEPEPEPEPVATAFAMTGAEACDELIVLQHCMARDVPEAQQAVLDSVKAWRDAITNETSRQMTVDTCVQSVPQMRDAAKSVGCVSTGALPCDLLLMMQRCMAKDVPEAVHAVEDAATAWRDAIANEASRQITIDTCGQMLPQMQEAAASIGCGL